MVSPFVVLVLLGECAVAMCLLSITHHISHFCLFVHLLARSFAHFTVFRFFAPPYFLYASKHVDYCLPVQSTEMRCQTIDIIFFIVIFLSQRTFSFGTQNKMTPNMNFQLYVILTFSFSFLVN